MGFQELGVRNELLERVRERRRHLAHRDGGPDARDDVLALSVDEKLPEETRLARRRVTREANSRRRGIVEVAIHHRLDVDRCPDQPSNAVDLPVLDRPRRVPAAEDGTDGHLQLLVRIRRHRLALGLVHPSEPLDDGAQVVLAEVHVKLDAGRVLDGLEFGLEELMGHPENDVPEHIEQPAHAVEGKAPAVLLCHHRQVGFVQSKIQNGIHHSLASASERRSSERGYREVVAGVLQGSPAWTLPHRSSRRAAAADALRRQISTRSGPPPGGALP